MSYKTHAAMCVYCGDAIIYDTREVTDMAAAHAKIIEHDQQCPKNPLVARIAELERIAAQFKEAALKASTNGYGQDEVHHDDSWIDELDEALRKIQLYDAKRAKEA